MSRLFAIEHEATTDAWYTPAWVFEGLGLEFDLDVASPPGGLPWIPAKRFYDENDDGLTQPWEGLVWCNPPYSDPAPWCLRYARHPDGLLLVRADLSSSGPYRAFSASDAIWVPRGRLSFVNGHQGPASGVNFSTVLFGRGSRAVEGMERLAQTHGGAMTPLLEPK